MRLTISVSLLTIRPEYLHQSRYSVNGKALPVSPPWIGDLVSVVDGVEYKVLRKEDILSKYN